MVFFCKKSQGKILALIVSLSMALAPVAAHANTTDLDTEITSTMSMPSPSLMANVEKMLRPETASNSQTPKITAARRQSIEEAIQTLQEVFSNDSGHVNSRDPLVLAIALLVAGSAAVILPFYAHHLRTRALKGYY